MLVLSRARGLRMAVVAVRRLATEAAPEPPAAAEEAAEPAAEAKKPVSKYPPHMKKVGFVTEIPDVDLDATWDPVSAGTKARGRFRRNGRFVKPIRISDKVFTNMFDLFKSDPVKWAPRVLAAEFGLPVGYIKHVLEMKATEAEVVKGYSDEELHHANKLVEEWEAYFGSRHPNLKDQRQSMRPDVRGAKIWRTYALDDAEAGAAGQHGLHSPPRVPADPFLENIRRSGRFAGKYMKQPKIFAGPAGPYDNHPHFKLLVTELGRRVHPRRKWMLVREEDGTMRELSRYERDRQAAAFGIGYPLFKNYRVWNEGPVSPGQYHTPAERLADKEAAAARKAAREAAQYHTAPTATAYEGPRTRPSRRSR